MFCPKCGKENPQHAKFCDNCGQALRLEPLPSDKQSVKELKKQHKLQEKAEKEARADLAVCEETAANLNKELRGLILVPIDCRHNLIAPLIDLWRFSTIDDRQFFLLAGGPPLRPASRKGFQVMSVGTVIEGVIPCTHVLKYSGPRAAFYPLPISPEDIKKFDAKKFYKERTGWNEATLRLNSDSDLFKRLPSPLPKESWTSRSYTYIRDDKKNPFTAYGQLVPQGDLTLAALLFLGPEKGQVARCIRGFGRIRAIIGGLQKSGFAYGPALGWNIMHLLRGDQKLIAGRIDPQLGEGWPLLARAYAIEAQVKTARPRSAF